MSLVTLAHICSHLQNCSRAHLTLTSLPSTNLNLALMHALQNSGFLSTVTRAGPKPPPYLYTTSHPSSSSAASSLDALHPDTAQITRSNIASRRLWVGLKYWNSEPVIRTIRMESKPTRRVWVGRGELQEMVLGRQGGRSLSKGMSVLGECLFLSTDRGVLEAREAVEMGIGGQLLVRVS
ncbi:MAG: hypothetical protein M1828_002285 [Chrysothrix sp. TS-e1954]|nr:MAG: hypothetical protein M1828_002285 [Chrysothrix sp. TS-e1954]